MFCESETLVNCKSKQTTSRAASHRILAGCWSQAVLHRTAQKGKTNGVKKKVLRFHFSFPVSCLYVQNRKRAPHTRAYSFPVFLCQPSWPASIQCPYAHFMRDVPGTGAPLGAARLVLPPYRSQSDVPASLEPSFSSSDFSQCAGPLGHNCIVAITKSKRPRHIVSLSQSST